MTHLPTFDAFFRALWGHDPYPWQRHLAQRACEDRWPDAIGVPTGAGKTAALDVALYALAAEAHRSPAERRHPRRVVVVVDRRTIVDQTFNRARAIRDRLVGATDGPLADVAARLRAYMGKDSDREDPIAVALLRGGIPRDDGWARRPDQVLLAVSTVDQVGSRLLFRGYGVRSSMQPIHAGLLGNDTLLVLDEVHLARAFEETLDAVGSRWQSWSSADLPSRWRVVKLSATGTAGDVLYLDDKDAKNERLAFRLNASKPTTCVDVDTATHKGRPAVPARGWIDALVREARRLVGEGRRSVGVVVNRVDTAREVHAGLQGDRRLDVVLITGRMRPCDRAEVIAEVMRRAGPDRPTSDEGDRPFICVATQCIEVGADLDFDAMVTELASVDALVQRFGRVNRTGLRDSAPIVVVAPRHDETDPIYGDTRAPTRRWLGGAGECFDAAPIALAEHLADAPTEAWPPRMPAAVLLPVHLDLLAQTGPTPAPDVDPAGFLHGIVAARPEVRIVWRADVDLEDKDASKERLDAAPPTSFEALSLPLGAARRWLAGQSVGSFGDAGAVDDDEWERGRRSELPVVGFVPDGQGSFKPATTRELRPNAVIVVPSSRGGLHAGNFDPRATSPVADRGDLGLTLRTGRPTARLELAIYGVPSEEGAALSWPASLGKPPPVPAPGATTSVAEARREVRAWLASITDDAPTVFRLLRGVATAASVVVAGGRWVIQGKPLTRDALLNLADGADERADLPLTADDDSTSIGRAVGLDDHLRGVAAWARAFAQAVGLDAAREADLAAAGRWHDLGKADPRFQVMLHGGDEIAAASGALRAKSELRSIDRGARIRAAKRARLPSGFRHEMASVALLERSEAGRALLADCSDPDLVLHLVASHHGFARPFAPPEDHRHQPEDLYVRVAVDDHALQARADHRLDALDAGVADRFFRLQQRYGWWGLAWLETLLRLADHRESESESRPDWEAP